MTEERSRTLKELQDVDLHLERVQVRIAAFEPMLEEVDAPALSLEQEAETLKGRLKDMRLEERRLERSADDRRSRSRMLQDRLKSVRTLREEAAVQAEMDLVRKALEGEEQEALTLLDQIRKMEAKLEEVEEARTQARAEVEPHREQILAEKAQAQAEVQELKRRRQEYAQRVSRGDLQTYERIRGGGRSVAVASLTPDGACGYCFNIVPLQVQNEIREGKALIPCEACGVLLSPAEEDS